MELEKNRRLQLMVEGTKQNIEVDNIMVLNKIMAAVGYNWPPIYTEVDCGVEAVKVYINLDSTSGEKKKLEVIEGEILTTKDAAKRSAVNTAVRYLEQKYMIKVLDFSSRISMSYSAYGTYGYVKETIESVRKVIYMFQNTLSKYNDFRNEVQGIQVNAQITAQIYDEMGNFLGVNTNMLTEKTLQVRWKMDCIEVERKRHQCQVKEKREAVANTGNTKKILVTSKVLLDYVLTNFGLQSAKYSNEPDNEGMVDAVVKMKFPYAKKLKYGGTIKQRAKGNTSSNAEENAAFQALMFIEENFNITVIDLNFNERVESENRERILIRMLGEVLDVGATAKEMLDNFVNKMAEKCRIFISQNIPMIAQWGENEVKYYKMCLDGIKGLEKESSNCILEYWDMLDKIDTMKSKLEVIKSRLCIH